VIAGISGKIVKKDVSSIDILTSGGVIYRVFVSINCYSAIKKDEVFIHTTAIYKEDSITLYGFIDLNEQKMFDMLIKVNGVGPKVAMAICSTFTPATFATIIQSADVNALKRTPGIGPKSAGVILVQLGSGVVLGENSVQSQHSNKNDAFLALESLGFKKELITSTLNNITAIDTSEIVKEALKRLQK